MRYTQVLMRGLVLISVCFSSASAWSAPTGPPTLPAKMRGISGAQLILKADLFTLLAKTDANVIRVGFSRDSASAPPPTASNPLAPYTANLAILDAALPMARARGIKIILCAAEVYGHDVTNKWTDPAKLATYSANVSSFWSAMAKRYLNEPAIVAYDVLNEPPTGSDAGWRGTVLPGAVAAIRAVNPYIWLVVEPGGSWGMAGGFSTMTKLADPYVIYSFHFYSPHSYCNQGINQYANYTSTYPGTNSMWGTTPAPSWDPFTYWDKETLRAQMKTAIDFARNNKVRMLVGEFAVIRPAAGGDKWYTDCIALFEEYGLDWTLHGVGGWSGYSVTYPANYNLWSVTLADGGDRGARWQVLYNGWKLNRLRPGRANPLPPAPR